MSVKQLRRAAEAQGWKVEQTRSGHWRFVPPDRAKPIVIVSGTPSDHRSMRNSLAMLKRSGFNDN